MQFHEKLKELRIKREYSQEDLADKLYVSRAAVVKWETANGMPDLNNLKAIADVFEVSVDSLIRDEKDIETTQNHFYKECMIAGTGIGGALGYMLKGELLLEALAGCVIGYFISRLLLVIQHKPVKPIFTTINLKSKQTIYAYLEANKKDLIFIMLGAGIGGIAGLWLWNQGLL